MKFFPARRVPVHLKETINEELTRLQNQGVIVPVDHAQAASPVVWIRNPGGGYRICVDYKVSLNDKICSDAYPVPTMEDIFASLEGAKAFAKIDLKSAYWQIELDEEARKYSVINTTKGLYQFTRLQMGMKNASAIFQRAIETVLKGVQGVVIYQDDVLVHAPTKSQLHKRLDAVKKRLMERNVTVNKDKCVEICNSVKFLGHIFSDKGISPDPSLVSRINDVPTPKNCKELQQFLGLANYFGRLIPKFSEICAPLYDALKDKDFKWTASCQANFEALKNALSSKPVLQPFSLQKESVLSTDASKSAIGGVLQQDNHPVIFISRKLTSAEKNYSNIEREALAIVWATKRLSQFLLGKPFKITTDHKPLVFLMDPNKPIPTDVSPRLAKWCIKLMAYDYVIEYLPGKENGHADAMSRVQYEDDVNVHIPSIHFVKPCLDVSELKEEYKHDMFLNQLKRRIQNGEWSKCSQKEQEYRRYKNTLTIEDDLIYCGSLCVPPQNLYRRIFDHAHQSHNGMHSTLAMIKKEFFWPQMSQYVETMVKNCEKCNTCRPTTPKVVHKWNSDGVWGRLHIDWAYNKDAGNILILVDSFSGWLEAFVCQNRTTSVVIARLRETFARFGVPYSLVADNAPEFSCHEFRSWIEKIGAKLLHSPEYFPRSNGAAERMVRVVKDAIRCYNPSKAEVASFLQRLLFTHRNTADRNGQTPSEILMSRKVRCPILSHYSLGQSVIYKPTPKTPAKVGTFVMRQGTNTSVVQLDDSRLITAHERQINPAVPRRSDRIRRPVTRYPDEEPGRGDVVAA